MFKKTFLVCLITLIGLANQTEGYNDKTSTVSSAYNIKEQKKNNNEYYLPEYYLHKIGSGYVSVNHRVGMTSGGYNVSVGSPINFSYNPDNPFFLNEVGGNWDTPYGEWVTDLSNNISKEKIINNGQYIDSGSDGNFGYIYWVATKPSVSIKSSEPSVVSCSGMNCNAVGSGVATLTAEISETQSRYWTYVYGIDSRDNIYTPKGSVLSNEWKVYYVKNGLTFYIRLLANNKTSVVIPSTSVSWPVTVTNPTPINGSCGTRNTSYLSTITAWPIGSTLCLAGAASPVSVAFPSAGSSSVWQCLGSSGGATVNCTATRDATAINGSCGSAQGSYLPTDTVWRAPFCNSGIPSPVAPIFPTLGSTTNWQCIGSGTGHTDAPCSATKNYANPTVTLTASPTTINNINNNTLTPGTANTTLTWSITNQAQACGGLCNCDLTDVSSGSTTSNIAYPATSSSTKTIGPGTYNYSITCRNPQNNTGTDTETVTATCTPQTGPQVCNQSCGDGNYEQQTIDANCNTGTITGGTCNLMNCPAGTKFEEVKL